MSCIPALALDAIAPSRGQRTIDGGLSVAGFEEPFDWSSWPPLSEQPAKRTSAKERFKSPERDQVGPLRGNDLTFHKLLHTPSSAPDSAASMPRVDKSMFAPEQDAVLQSMPPWCHTPVMCGFGQDSEGSSNGEVTSPRHSPNVRQSLDLASPFWGELRAPTTLVQDSVPLVIVPRGLEESNEDDAALSVGMSALLKLAQTPDGSTPEQEHRDVQTAEQHAKPGLSELLKLAQSPAALYRYGKGGSSLEQAQASVEQALPTACVAPGLRDDTENALALQHHALQTPSADPGLEDAIEAQNTHDSGLAYRRSFLMSPKVTNTFLQFETPLRAHCCKTPPRTSSPLSLEQRRRRVFTEEDRFQSPKISGKENRRPLPETPNNLPMTLELSTPARCMQTPVLFGTPAWCMQTPLPPGLEEDIEERLENNSPTFANVCPFPMSPKVSNTFLQFETPLRAKCCEDPPLSVPPFFAPSGVMPWRSNVGDNIGGAPTSELQEPDEKRRESVKLVVRIADFLPSGTEPSEGSGMGVVHASRQIPQLQMPHVQTLAQMLGQQPTPPMQMPFQVWHQMQLPAPFTNTQPQADAHMEQSQVEHTEGSPSNWRAGANAKRAPRRRLRHR